PVRGQNGGRSPRVDSLPFSLFTSLSSLLFLFEIGDALLGETVCELEVVWVQLNRRLQFAFGLCDVLLVLRLSVDRPQIKMSLVAPWIHLHCLFDVPGLILITF